MEAAPHQVARLLQEWKDGDGSAVGSFISIRRSKLV
jgi:hypothetical protein